MESMGCIMSDPSGFVPVTRHLVMEKDLNAFGNLFGGTMLSWLDEGSALYVMERISYTNFVTVSLADVQFKAPAHRGDAIIIFCRTDSVGRSSITVRTRALVNDSVKKETREIIECRITFVCLRDGKPYAHFEEHPLS